MEVEIVGQEQHNHDGERGKSVRGGKENIFVSTRIGFGKGCRCRQPECSSCRRRYAVRCPELSASEHWK